MKALQEKHSLNIIDLDEERRTKLEAITIAYVEGEVEQIDADSIVYSFKELTYAWQNSFGSTRISGFISTMAESHKISKAGGQATGLKTVLPFLRCHGIYTLLWEEPQHFCGASARLTQFCSLCSSTRFCYWFIA